MRQEIVNEGVWIDNARQTVDETVEAVLTATGLGRAASRR
jgi:hypothetical protein